MILSVNAYGPGSSRFQIDETYESKAHFLEEAFIDNLDATLPNVQSTLPNEAHPNIRRYTLNTDCGYMVFGWVNQEAVFSYQEECEFKKFEGAKTIQPFKWSPAQGHFGLSVSQAGYKAKILPGEKKIVILEIELDAAQFAMSQAMKMRFVDPNQRGMLC